ncbi:hypothetical protein [Actinophytocola sp.]|uniref:hypothetical protein n=1 Tax=Actinophytocola sp. TaxID=1872138 RepID=UPI00389AC0F1
MRRRTRVDTRGHAQLNTPVAGARVRPATDAEEVAERARTPDRPRVLPLACGVLTGLAGVALLVWPALWVTLGAVLVALGLVMVLDAVRARSAAARKR